MLETEKNHLFVLSAPSGAGKTSLSKALVERIPDARISVSHTTRERKNGERHGRDYFFVEKAEFMRMIAANQFIEHAQVFDHYYGTSIAAIDEILSEGGKVILEIDWQGARKVREHFPAACTIFILPPSKDTLLDRLRTRGRDDPAVIDRRMAAAMDEMSHYDEFDYIIVNDDFEQALLKLVDIVAGQVVESDAVPPGLRIES